MSTELMVSDKSQGFMIINNLEQAIKISEIIANSNFCPTSMRGKPGDVLICLQFGQEVGLKPLQAVQNIAPINGRPSIWGDAMLALCQQSPDFEYIKEDFDPETMTATCTVKRRNHEEHSKDFSEEKARKAGLWGKAGPWTQYTERMLQMRARGFALRDKFAPELRGLIIKEEAEDYPESIINYSAIKTNSYGGFKPVIIENKPKIVELINHEQANELKELADALGAKLEKTCDHFNIDSVDQMSVTQWSQVMSQFEKKLLKKNEEEFIKSQGEITEAAKEFFGE